MPDTIAATEPITLAYPVDGVHPRLLVHSRAETISNFVRDHRAWQRHITVFLSTHLRPGDVFVDVGANIGYFSVYAGLRVGARGKVHAIEPDQDNLSLLSANVALNRLSNVQVHPLAASYRNGEAPLFRGTFNRGAHSLLPQGGLSEGPAVPLVRLDELLAEGPTPRLIKIDVQGADLEVLRGATGLLGRPAEKPGIILEFSPLTLQRNGLLEELFDFITRNDYSLRAFITNASGRVIPPQLRWSTLREIANDFVATSDAAEFDILLLPRPQTHPIQDRRPL
jgi:FkbM family methyltransferase